VRYLQASVIGFAMGAVSAWAWGWFVERATRPLTELDEVYPPRGDLYVLDLIRDAGA
jgi:hypothetical protein